MFIFQVPAKIREIITKHLSTEDLSLPDANAMATTPNATSIKEENVMLQAELNRVEDLLAASRAERDEIGIKYNALSERVSRALIMISYYVIILLLLY